MRYYIMFAVTLIIALIIIFYNPYLGTYKDSITIEFESNDDSSWELVSESKCFDITEEENKWILKPIKNCKEKIEFKNNDINVTYEFKTKGKKIYWLEGSADKLYDFPNPY